MTIYDKIVRLADKVDFKLESKVDSKGITSFYLGGDEIFKDKNISENTLKEIRELVKNKLESPLYKDPLLKLLFEGNYHYHLVGGAVVDIHEGRTPKDYDFIYFPQSLLDEKANFVDTSSVADTYKMEVDKKQVTIQILKTATSDFDFTVSTTYIKSIDVKINSFGSVRMIGSNLLSDLSYKTKLLIPTSYKEENALNSLLRIPHWRKKGFSITDNTYRHLLFAATRTPIERRGDLDKSS